MKPKVILIGGSSHSGKSTVGRALGSELGVKCISTDSLARHPGRPWNERAVLIPAHVRKHYSSLSVEELIHEVLNHYNSQWPGIYSNIRSHLIGPASNRLILEGSAIWPDLVNTIESNNMAAMWLTASDNLFRKRIYASANFRQAAPPEKRLINKFLARTIRYNKLMMERIDILNLPFLNVENFSNPGDLVNECLRTLTKSLNTF